MSKKDDALKLALDYITQSGFQTGVNEAITAVREALAEQPAQQQEPSMAYKVKMCPRQECASASKCTSFSACSTRAYIKPEQPAQQQVPVPDTLYFAQWTAAKKDLSDYIHVGSLSLAGIEDGEYGTPEIDPFDNTIEALQEKLVTGSDHKKVPLLAYIGALNSTSPPASKPWAGLTDEEFAAMWMRSNIYGTNREKAIALGRAIEAKLKEKNA